jgi:hypothetical protein
MVNTQQLPAFAQTAQSSSSTLLDSGNLLLVSQAKMILSRSPLGTKNKDISPDSGLHSVGDELTDKEQLTPR